VVRSNRFSGQTAKAVTTNPQNHKFQVLETEFFSGEPAFLRTKKLGFSSGLFTAKAAKVLRLFFLSWR
jgi:hypothetical protein